MEEKRALWALALSRGPNGAEQFIHYITQVNVIKLEFNSNFLDFTQLDLVAFK